MRYAGIYMLLILVVPFLRPLYASEHRYQSLGLSASVYSGTGLSYRYNFADRWTVQITGGAIITDDIQNYATGLEVQRDLSMKKEKRLFLIMALGIYGDRQEVYTKGDYLSTTDVNIDYYKAAIGFGGELAFGDEILNHLTLGISIFPIGFSIKERHSYPGYDNTDEVGFGASIFTHFNF